MMGVDYSETSVKLARQIGEARISTEEEESKTPITFEEFDILNPQSLPSAPEEGFDVVLDKGTFDAISLSADTNAEGHRICEGYCEKVLPFVRSDGLFIITSCNWTEAELRKWFETDARRMGSFVLEDKIKYPSFKFGGAEGQSVVTLCFRKVGRK